MNAQQTLDQQITSAKKLGYEFPKVPECITNNLNPKFNLRPYQEEAFSRFIYYFNNSKIRQRPSQVLYHMATGSGKTLIMAGLILYLYEQGYRNFLFFVNSTNIINKTRENFLNQLSSKYLFNQEIKIGLKSVNIKERSNFQFSDDNDINIVFTTIQGLHTLLNDPKENSLTYDDFFDNKVVMISDEAHHLNAETKRKSQLTKKEKENISTWEGTINRIFRSNSENILLEFTATIDMSHPNIENKYFDKLIFDYSLKQFRSDGYSKEVKVLQADIDNMTRSLQACLLSQYRRKVFEAHGLHIKPVILFKSKTIKESNNFYKEFVNKIKHLTIKDINNIRESTNEEILKRMFRYFNHQGVTTENIVNELKVDFSEEKCLEVNSKKESEEKQIAVNTLEDYNNEFRAIFAVDMLNEGWDVLNLFDIVRLYDTRDKNTKTGKLGKTTISEAQLIGRGARYCPFRVEEHQPLDKRKYDNDINNDLRICEELYYHSNYNPKYIQELNEALQKIGMKPKRSREIHLKLKPDFKESVFYNKGYIFVNQRVKHDRSDIYSLPSSIREQRHKIKLKTGYSKSTTIFSGDNIGNKKTSTKNFNLLDLGFPIIRKAIDKLEFYKFYNLKSFFPNLKSIREFILSDKYLGAVKIEVVGNEESLKNLSTQEKLDISIQLLEKFRKIIESEAIEYKGTEEFVPHSIKEKVKEKTLNIYVNEDGDQEYGVGQSETNNEDLRLDLTEKSWYVFTDNYGTSEEKYLVKLIDKMHKDLQEKFKNVYLVRNEKHFQLYNFDDGRPFEPDFVLFLEHEDSDKSVYYQIFIEPKGDHLVEKDQWKESFLKELKDKHKLKVLWKTKEYLIWGMPFYNENNKLLFESTFKKIIENDAL